MKRLARILGLIGGLGALAWAMRDRLVSVAISREPVPPAFKIPDPVYGTGAATVKRAGEITAVNGIGPVYATRLESIGVSTIEGLATSRAEQVAAAAEVPLSRAVGWIEAARGMSTQS